MASGTLATDLFARCVFRHVERTSCEPPVCTRCQREVRGLSAWFGPHVQRARARTCTHTFTHSACTHTFSHTCASACVCVWCSRVTAAAGAPDGALHASARSAFRRGGRGSPFLMDPSRRAKGPALLPGFGCVVRDKPRPVFIFLFVLFVKTEGVHAFLLSYTIFKFLLFSYSEQLVSCM